MKKVFKKVAYTGGVIKDGLLHAKDLLGSSLKAKEAHKSGHQDAIKGIQEEMSARINARKDKRKANKPQ